jgi:tetratricopeptide (TPR) repeat protein
VYHGTIQDLILRPIAESKDGWVRIRQGTKSGWFAKEDSVALDRAVDYFNRRIARDPLDVYAHVAKAAALVELGEVSQAVPPLDAAVRLQPREARWLEMRAEAQVRLGDLEAARRDYRKANEVSPARRVEQEKVLRELKNQRENLLEQERVYEARMRTLEDREKASGASGAGETTQEANRMERESLLRIREGLNEKAEDVARKQIRTGQPDDSEMGKAEIDSRGSDGKSSVLDSLSGIDLTLGSAEGLRRHTDDGGKPVITGTWSPDTDRGWFIYEFEKDGKVTRKPGKGNIDSSTKYGKWKIKEADRKSAVLELPESGRRGYSSYSPAVTVEVQILSASALRIAGNPYSGGNVKFDED